MSPTTAYHTLPQPPAGPSRVSGRNAKSSRRTRGSTGPAVLLGGGAGALGSGSAGGDGYVAKEQWQISHSGGHENSLRPRSNTTQQASSPLFPVHFSSVSPVSPSFPSPISPSFPGMNRAASPLARLPVQPVPTQAPSYHSSRPSASSSRSNQSSMGNPGASNSSLSTAASTSTLKTPHSKLETQPNKSGRSTMVASSSTDSQNSLGRSSGGGSPTPAMPSKDRYEQQQQPRRSTEPRQTRSPTPTQRSVSSGTKVPRLPPAMAQGPLPPTPPTGPAQPLAEAAHPFKSSPPRDVKPRAGRTKAPPAPLHIRKRETNLSQDWIHVDKNDEYREPKISPRLPLLPPPHQEASGSHGASAKAQPRLGVPAPMMVPMKNSSPSPKRPTYDRANTAPPTSPSRVDRAVPQSQDGRAQKQGRGSLDRLRSVSPGPGMMRPRQSSFSTPPAALLDAAPIAGPSGSSGSSGKMSLFRSGTTKASPQAPPLRARRSEDVLRPSTDSPAMSKKDVKAMMKEQQKALGVMGGATPSTAPAEERKTSGLSLKKSSGALKALFRSGKKDRSETPPLPDRVEQQRAVSSKPRRPSTAPKEGSPQMFGSGSRSNTATPSAPGPSDRKVSAPPMAEYEQGRRSLGVERSLYPAPPIMRATSHGPQMVLDKTSGASHPTLQLPVRQRLPSRDLPPLPPVSPVGQTSTTSEPSRPETAQSTENKPQPRQPKLADALPVSSLPYLSPVRASFILESGSESATAPSTAATSSGSASSTVTVSEVPSTAKSMATSSTASPASSSSTTRRPSTASITPTLEDPLKTSRSLHLLSLPDLDLDFNFDSAFDRIGASPSTPRRSPQKSRSRASPSSPTPQRSLTVRQSPRASPKITRVNSERRRTRSFDGLPSPLTWASREDDNDSATFDSPDLNKLFAAATSSSMPGAPELAPSSSVESNGSDDGPVSVGVASELAPSAPPSSSHGRTPSNASSTNDSRSPSPPRTPEDVKLTSFPVLPPVPKLQDSVYSVAPTIPLPALPPTAAAPVTPPNPPAAVALAPSALINDLKPIEPTQPAVRPARMNKPVLINRSVTVRPDQRTIFQLAREMERALYAFRSPSASSTVDRANIVRNDLMPLLNEMDKRIYGEDEHGSKALREQSFQWIDELLLELRVEQAANERGACLEGLACVFESPCLSEEGLKGDLVHQTKFTDAMVKAMSFVMSKLGAKGVFHNTLLFSGRFLAFAFFRVPHIGEQLVTVLPPPRGALMRFTRPALVGSSLPASAQPKYPKHLAPLCFDDSRAYTARLGKLGAEFNTEKEKDAFLFTPGNWLRRWQSDDSELFPAFYRAYHLQLARYLAPAIKHYEQLNQPLPASVLLRAPGYAHLATIFAKKCHSYILGSVNAVTTSSSAQSFEATETAGFRGSQKPAVLETANRRLVETLSTFATVRVNVPMSNGVIACDGRQLYSGMLDMWTRNLVSKTSLYAPKGVFSLFDLLDGIVDPPADSITGERRLTETSLLDVPHLIHVIRLILTQGEHALTLVKVIAFVFTHWEVLTAKCEDRKELCLELLLEKDLFERLLLFWSQSVRSYVLRLVVFRLGHLHTKTEDGEAHEVEIESVRLLQSRLDRIRRRHDELEPKQPSETEEEVDELYLTPLDGGSMPRSKSTITMVTDSPRTGSTNKAERLLGLGFGNVEKEEEPTTKVVGKATSWLKKSFGGGAKKKRKGEESVDASPSLGSSPNLGASPLFTSPNMGNSPAFGSSPESSSSSFGNSPLLGYMKKTPELRQTPQMAQPVSPVPDSPASSGESSSPTTETGTGPSRKARPPRITTSESSPIVAQSEGAQRSPSSFAFEFELPTMSPRSDTFDPTPLPGPISPRRSSQPPSPRQPTSPHMSRSFSKRTSLLPPSTASVLASESPSPRRERLVKVEREEKGYDKMLHAYAIRMLAELEDAQKEYDEWWSEGGVGRMDGAPPRLTVAWPFHEGED